MKTHIFKQLAVCGAVFALASCIKPNIPGGGDGERYGLLSISSIGVVEDVREKNHEQASTRAVSVDNFDLSITRVADGVEVHNSTCSELDELELPAGDYLLYIESHEQTAPEWDKVHYSASRNFEIREGETTTLNDVVCRVSSILVSVKYTEKMLEALSGDYGVDIKIGNHTLNYENGDGRTGGFVAEAETNVLVWDFEGAIESEDAIEGEDISQSSFIPNVRAGEHRILTFDIELTSDTDPATGDATFDVVVSVECDAYDVNRNVEIEQEVIAPLPGTNPGPGPDPAGSVVIAGDGFDIDNVMNVPESKQNETPVKVNITAPEGIAKFVVSISSTSGSFMTALADIGFPASFDIANPGDLAEELTDLGLINGSDVLGKTSVAFDISQFIPLLFLMPDEEFDANFSLTVTDKKGASATKTIKLHLIKGQ